MIACVTIPDFAVTLARRVDSTLAARPLLVGVPPETPERVYAVSSEVVGAGIRPGMLLRQAQLLCPEAYIIPAQPSQEQAAFDQLLTVLANFTNLIELDSTGQIAHGYLDLGYLSGATSVKLVKDLGRTIREQTGLAPALGLASGKFPAQVAAISVSPNRASVIASGREAIFLAPRSIGLLPLDETLAYRFRLLGLRTLGQLAALPAGAMLVQFGKYGHWLHQLARGHDQRPIQPRRPSTVEQVSHQFDEAIGDWLVLTSLIRAIATELAERLQDSGRVGQALQVTLELENGAAWTERRVLRQSTGEAERLRYALEALLNRAPLPCGVTAVTVSMTDLSPAGGQQLELFTLEDGAEQTNRLRQVLPELISRYGRDSFFQTAVTNPLAYLPESRFHLWPAQGL